MRGDLVDEVEQILALATQPIGTAQADDMTTIVETLVTEIVNRTVDDRLEGASRVAS